MEFKSEAAKKITQYFNVEIKDYIGYITFNKPPVNTCNLDIYNGLGDFMQEVGENKDVRVIIFKAEGRMFCAGFDVKELAKLASTQVGENKTEGVSPAVAATRKGLIKLVDGFYNCKVPVICAVHGHCVGVGAIMATISDILVASDDADFSVPEIKQGVIGASGFFARLVPEKLMRYYILTGDKISAQDMAKFGGVNSVVPKDQLVAEAERIAKLILANPPIPVQKFKKAMNIIADAKFAWTYQVESDCYDEMTSREDVLEARKAFVEKRPPVYRGC